MIAPESIQQVINRSDIVEVIGQFLKLRKRGTNYIANCPFHNEKSPSFNVNPAKGIYKCFGCGKGGDVVSFVEEYEKFSFVEAIRWLANYYQITLNETEAPEEYKHHQQIEESLRIINEFAAQYFQDILANNEEGQLIGGSYFRERGFRQHIIDQFRLGYCLDKWDGFVTEALSKGYSQELLEKAGLIKARDGRPYDNYKGRVIFPIFSATGRILGFGARILKKTDHAPKYVNSPENELYVKNKVLYGLYQSRQSISKQDECFLVEGYTDVISLHQAGVTNVVASSGTSLTEGQLKLISNLTKNLTILYDGDAAGIKAAMRGLDMALAESFNVKLVLLPDGEDPDSFVQQSGAEAFNAYVAEHKRDVIGFRLEVGMKEAGNDPMKKSQLVNEIAETISRINKTEDFTLQQHYIRESATQLQIDEQGLINLVNKFIRERLQQEQRQQERRQSQEAALPDEPLVYVDEATGESMVIDVVQKDHREEWQLLRILLEYGDKPYKDAGTVAQLFFETIDLDLIENTLARQMVTEYHEYWAQNHLLPDQKYFTSHTDRNIRQKAADLLHTNYAPSLNWQEKHRIEVLHGDQIYEEEIESTFAYFELKLLRRLLNENMKQMQHEKDVQKIMTLMKAHQSLKQREKELMAIVIIR
ncbi:DNA primase [Taibaiella helva]|uniref:DNA primase n=1 Tax=Taibaiella helva TaxID=2301235 RepID=UPI000E594128|nr:DNA primase [Taibaiella helva]